MKAFTIFLVSQTHNIGYSELLALRGALEINARHCADAWASEGVKAPAIEVGTTAERVPEGCFPLIFMDEGSEKGILANHYYDMLRRGPAGRVFVDHCSGFNKGEYSVAESASHEVVEMVVNPRIDQWRPSPLAEHDPLTTRIALEVADPVQDHYSVISRGTPFKMANFILPSWFDRSENLHTYTDYPSHNEYDYKGKLSYAGEILPGGYVITSTKEDGKWKRGYRSGILLAIGDERARRDHALSRTHIHLHHTQVG